MELIKKDFLNILKNQRIKPVFQPIVSLNTGEILGYEGLSRIVAPQTIDSSEELFRLAGLYGKIWELEQICRSKILEKYHHFFDTKSTQKLFLNVSPLVIHDQEFRIGFTSEYLHKYNLGINNIIFEVTERNAVDDIRGFKDTIRHYKSQGYAIAVDDAGSCYSGLNLICDIEPHYLKLDLSLIHDIDKNTIKYAMVKAMVEFANLSNIQLIAEGIETEEELKTLLKLGVPYGQGYYLRKPNEELKPVKPEAFEIIQKYNRKKAMQMNRYYNGQKRFCAVLFKFDNYKTYNLYCEKYGDQKGDSLTDLLKNIINQNLSEEECAVLMSSDTILTILQEETYKIKCESIINMFEKESRNYYDKEVLQKGYLDCKNKRGKRKKLSLITVCSERLV